MDPDTLFDSSPGPAMLFDSFDPCPPACCPSRPIRRHASVPTTLFVLALAAAACGDGGGPTGPVAPVVSITAPSTGSTAFEGSTVRFEGSATDPQDGSVPDADLIWASSIDGTLGTGSSVESSDLSVGIHTVTLSARDTDGHEGRAAISLGIQELEFLDGTVEEPEIGIIVSTLANAVRLFQLGDPDNQRDIPLGASSSVTPTGISIRGEVAAVPLGNAASVAILDLRSQQIDGFFLFEKGNATGSDFGDDETLIVANQETDEVGKFRLGQASQAISETTAVAPFPTDVVRVSDSRVLVISSNLDDSYAPTGEGVVTAIDPETLGTLGTVETGGLNPQYGALGPDGLLYVTNTGDYVGSSSLAVIDPQSLVLVDLVEGFPAGSGHVFVDGGGRVYVSGFFFGTVIWDPSSQAFLRGPENPVCVLISTGGCRGGVSSYTARDGSLFQTSFGSPAQGLSPWIFQYSAETFELLDSIPSGPGPAAVEIRQFR